MTAFADSDKGRKWVVEKCTEFGMRGILYKPINKKGLSIQVEKNISLELLKKLKEKRRNKQRSVN